MSKIKVLEVIRQGQIGGGESHLLDLITFLDKERFEPVCLSFTSGEMISCHVIETQKPFDRNFCFDRQALRCLFPLVLVN